MPARGGWARHSPPPAALGSAHRTPRGSLLLNNNIPPPRALLKNANYAARPDQAPARAERANGVLKKYIFLVPQFPSRELNYSTTQNNY